MKTPKNSVLGSVVLGALLVIASLSSTTGFMSNCQREPHGVDLPKTPGGGGFRIILSGNPENYVPGEVYIVSIKGKRSHFRMQKFTGFLLVVEATHVSKLYGPQSVGNFQLYGDIQTMHSESCPNAIKEASNIQKGDIQVRWTAPPSGSGCLKFKATVVDSQGHWYMDDDELTKDLCEEVQQSDYVRRHQISDCCACNEAKYEVTFEGLWSRQTHPKDFPANEWLTHFSDIIGASHSSSYKVWGAGKLASDGLKQVAEWGSTRILESELKRQSDHIRTIIKARGLWYPNVNGKTFAVFRVDNQHHLMSLVSMLGPSPDWVVGISALELCMKNCSWVPQKTLNMYPWDAGTDSGVTYMSANSATIPREKIHRITNASPNDPKSPFFDPSGHPMKPLARLTITRQRVYEKSCSDTGYPAAYESDYDTIEDSDTEIPECATTEWSVFTPCSMSCGKGLRRRTRHYQIPLKADMFRCNRQLIETEMCAGIVPYCEDGNMNSIFGAIKIQHEPFCETTPWSRWSPCSVTCGKGFSMRSRRYLNRMGKKRCSETLTENKECMGEMPVCDRQEQEQIDPGCSVTQWTNWSPCSVTCGKGIRVRTRHFLVPSATEDSCKMKIMDKLICEGERPDCTIDQNEAREICLQPKIDGPCRGYFPRWYYDSTKRICIQFIYGGCRGNQNNFKMYDECTKMCEFSRDDLHSNADTTNAHNHLINLPYPGDRNTVDGSFNGEEQRFHMEGSYGVNGLISENQLAPKVDCVVSDWSEWSSWTNGWAERRRFIQVEPQNGGKSCPKKMLRRRKCKKIDCKVNNRHKLQSMSFVFDPYLEYSSPILPSANKMSETGSRNQVSMEDEFESENIDMDCVLGDWGPWSPCTHSCGTESLQQRARSIVVKARGRGISCGPTLERRYCSLPPCPSRYRN